METIRVYQCESGYSQSADGITTVKPTCADGSGSWTEIAVVTPAEAYDPGAHIPELIESTGWGFAGVTIPLLVIIGCKVLLKAMT